MGAKLTEENVGKASTSRSDYLFCEGAAEKLSTFDEDIGVGWAEVRVTLIPCTDQIDLPRQQQ